MIVFIANNRIEIVWKWPSQTEGWLRYIFSRAIPDVLLTWQFVNTPG